MLVTAAGTLPPARVVVLGAGVAGLQAIATARRLGAVVSAFDVRPAVKEQVESLGAKFLEMDIGEHAETAGGYAKELSEETHRRELAFIAQQLKDADVVVTTAAIPGKRAPILITAEAVRGMKLGAVIVDLAVETGGNCELARPGEDVLEHGVRILGPLNLPSTMPYHASQMYARNISTFVSHVVKDGALRLDFADEHRERLPDHGPHAEDVQEAMTHAVAQLAAVLATALFIFSLHWMNDPKTARRGVAAGVTGMLVAVVATWIQPEIIHHGWVALAIVAGFVVGVPLSLVPLTAVPQRTALSHAFGGLAAGLVGTAEYFLGLTEHPAELTAFRMSAIVAEVILGFLTFTGSLMAAGKLQEVKWIPQRPVTY